MFIIIIIYFNALKKMLYIMHSYSNKALDQ